ncbi:MAG: hydroxyethylthiazole kinase [Butyrivibrio sp.]|nr:hydroxyethylthiazole kinase [Butyrivibrio sp.]
MEKDLCQKIREEAPLIHCITNPISMMQCANSILALGARPIMAEHPLEVKDITKSAKALVLNFGNITDARLEAMGVSYKAARKNGIPTVIDAVGAACSKLRREYIKKLIDKNEDLKMPLLVKGNYSEIQALLHDNYKASGVDADKELTYEEVCDSAIKLAKDKKVIVLASGKEDIVTDGKMIATVSNGVEKLGKVTGTGCMLGVICGCFFSQESSIRACVRACAALGISSEKAKEDVFILRVIDELSLLTDKEIDERMKVKWTEIV